MKKLSGGHEGLARSPHSCTTVLHHQPVQLWEIKSKELKRKIKVFKAKLSGLNIIRSKNVNVFRYFAPKVHFQLGTFVRWVNQKKDESEHRFTNCRLGAQYMRFFFSFKSTTHYLGKVISLP